MTTLSKLAALASHQGTPENEWQSAAVAYFRHHRRHGTSPAEQPAHLDVATFVSKSNAFWQSRAPRGPVWTPTEAEGNTKYPGLNIQEIVMRDMEYAVELNAAHYRRAASSRKRRKK